MEWYHVTKEAYYCLKYLYMFLYMYAVQNVYSVRLLIIPRTWTEGIRKPGTYLFFLDTSPAFSVCAGWWERTPDISGLCCSWAWTTGLGKITKSQAFKYNLVQSSFKSKTNSEGLCHLLLLIYSFMQIHPFTISPSLYALHATRSSTKRRPDQMNAMLVWLNE